MLSCGSRKGNSKQQQLKNIEKVLNKVGGVVEAQHLLAEYWTLAGTNSASGMCLLIPHIVTFWCITLCLLACLHRCIYTAQAQAFTANSQLVAEMSSATHAFTCNINMPAHVVYDKQVHNKQGYSKH